jgi:hypothetical protein
MHTLPFEHFTRLDVRIYKFDHFQCPVLTRTDLPSIRKAITGLPLL